MPNPGPPKSDDPDIGQYRRILVAWVTLVSRHAVVTLLLAALFSSLAGYYAVANMAINTDTADMLSADLPFRRDAVQLKQAFPQNTDTVLVVIDAPTPDMAGNAAQALVTGMQVKPDLFGAVFYPEGETFFRRNGLLYLPLEELYELTDRLATAQPILGRLSENTDLPTLLEILTQALNEGTEADRQSLAPLFREIGDVAASMNTPFARPLSWQRVMGSTDEGTATGRRLIILQPPLDFTSLQPAKAAMTAVRQTAQELGLTPNAGITVRLTGSAALAEEELQSVQTGMGVAGVISLTLVFGLLWAGLRSTGMVAATLCTLIAGLLWTAGFAILAIGHLNLISVAFIVLFIGLSVDFGIHFALRYRENLDSGLDKAAALQAATAGVGTALTLCAVAAAISFFSFLPTSYVGLAELGLISGVSMFIALAANLTVLPAFLSLLPRPRHKMAAQHKGADDNIVARHPRTTVFVAMVLATASVAIAPSARFDFDPMSLRNDQTESMATLRDLDASGDADLYSIEILSPDLSSAEKTANRLAALEEVKSAVTLADYVPTEQEDKLFAIDDTNLILGSTLSRSPRMFTSSSQSNLQALRDFKSALAEQDDDQTKALAQTLEQALNGLADDPQSADRLEQLLLAEVPALMDDLRLSLTAQPVTIDQLPEILRSRVVAADGRAKIEVFAKGDMQNLEELEKFVAAVRSVAANATGTPVIVYEAGKAVLEAFIEAAAISITAIAALVIILLRRLRDTMLVFAPLTLAALLTVAASSIFNLPFNFANVIVLPLLFGLGVAGGIHLVLRARQTGGQDTSAPDHEAEANSTPRAVLFSALTTIGSFASIALSDHPGTASMGILLAIAISMTLASTLVVLPALMRIWPPKPTPLSTQQGSQ